MRVTQSMIAGNNLKYINQNYNRLAKLQDQVNSGKKITKPSDDPVVAMKGMRYRTQLVEVNQFSRNLTEGFNWMDNADSALDETTQVLHRIRDLTVQASNDSYDEGSRKNIADEISQLQEHIVALANTKVGDNYIFNGTDTAAAPINEAQFNIDFNKFSTDLVADNGKNYVISYKGQTYEYMAEGEFEGEFVVQPEIKYTTVDAAGVTTDEVGYAARLKIAPDGTITQTSLEKQDNLNGAMIETTKELASNDLVITNVNAVSSNSQDVRIEVMKGVSIPINVNSQGAFSLELFSGLESIKKMLLDPETTGAEITKSLDTIDGFMNDIISTQAELGAIVNRAEMIESRLLEQKEIATNTISNNEDIEIEEAIINLTIQQSLHRASLAVGAKIIQPTLMDFLR